MLTINNLAFSFEGKPVLKEISFSLKQGEIGSLIGVSGTGKTTLFKLLTGLYQASHGMVLLNGDTVPEGYRHVTYMMQEDLLLPWRNVIDNLMLLSELGSQTHTTKDEAIALLQEIGLGHAALLYPHQLSVGMKQRVSLARAVLQKRPILLLDEPFASLDVSLREQMYTLMQQVRAKYQTTILMITHDFRDALSLSDRIFLLEGGRIQSSWSINSEIHNDPIASAKIQAEMRTALMNNATP